ncbi:MAG TPA: cytochrome c family protein [Caulobacteraceae bacterium]|jgi:cytochrome c
MRHSALAVLAALLALGGCGPKDEPVMPQAGGALPADTGGGEVSPEQAKAMLASLPAPYSGGDVENGKRKSGLCRSCHSFTPGGPNMTGPNLHGVVGQKAAHHPGYSYSDPLKSSGLTWDAPTLDKWLENPRTLVPGNKMTFAGLKSPQDRIDVIAYLRTQAKS